MSQANTKLQRWVVPATFDEADGLPGDPDPISEFGLREVSFNPGEFEPVWDAMFLHAGKSNLYPPKCQLYIAYWWIYLPFVRCRSVEYTAEELAKAEGSHGDCGCHAVDRRQQES